MNKLIIVGHPNMNESKANKALVAEAKKAKITIIELDKGYKIDNVRSEMEKADKIVLQFPLYWYSTPAILKEFLDSILTYGWAFGSNGQALKNKELLLATTIGGPKSSYTKDGRVTYTIEELFLPLKAISNLIGTKYLKPFCIYGVANLSESELKIEAKTYIKYLN